MQLLGEKIRELRKRRRYSQALLGDAVGVTAQAISSYEIGRTEPPYATLAAIADVLGVKTSYFLGEDTEGYYISHDTAEKAQELFDNKDLRILFDAAKDARPEDLQLAAEMLRRLKETNND